MISASMNDTYIVFGFGWILLRICVYHLSLHPYICTDLELWKCESNDNMDFPMSTIWQQNPSPLARVQGKSPDERWKEGFKNPTWWFRWENLVTYKDAMCTMVGHFWQDQQKGKKHTKAKCLHHWISGDTLCETCAYQACLGSITFSILFVFQPVTLVPFNLLFSQKPCTMSFNFGYGERFQIPTSLCAFSAVTSNSFSAHFTLLILLRT